MCARVGERVSSCVCACVSVYTSCVCVHDCLYSVHIGYTYLIVAVSSSQRGVSQVKSVVRRRPVSSLLAGESMPEADGPGAGQRALSPPGDGVLSPAGSTLEVGAATMLQVTGRDLGITDRDFVSVWSV